MNYEVSLHIDVSLLHFTPIEKMNLCRLAMGANIHATLGIGLDETRQLDMMAFTEVPWNGPPLRVAISVYSSGVAAEDVCEAPLLEALERREMPPVELLPDATLRMLR